MGALARGLRVATGVRGGRVVVHGTPTCGWTRKQLAELERSSTPHSFVDCSTGACPAFVEVYPTVVVEGFTRFG